MLKNYLLILFLFLCFKNQAQDIHVTLGKCSRNAVSGSKAFNLKNLKYYATLSQKAIDAVMTNSDFIDCLNAYDLSQSVAIHLQSALLNDDFATAQSHLLKVEEITTEIFNEYNRCTIEDDSNPENESATNNANLSALELKQKKLKQQQAELEKQKEELHLKLKAQQTKKLALKRQSFITENETTVSKNINTYNTTLKAYGCSSVMESVNLNDDDLADKNLDQLKIFYINKTLSITETYRDLLNKCKAK